MDIYSIPIKFLTLRKVYLTYPMFKETPDGGGKWSSPTTNPSPAQTRRTTMKTKLIARCGCADRKWWPNWHQQPVHIRFNTDDEKPEKPLRLLTQAASEQKKGGTNGPPAVQSTQTSWTIRLCYNICKTEPSRLWHWHKNLRRCILKRANNFIMDGILSVLGQRRRIRQASSSCPLKNDSGSLTGPTTGRTTWDPPN